MVEHKTIAMESRHQIQFDDVKMTTATRFRVLCCVCALKVEVTKVSVPLPPSLMINHYSVQSIRYLSFLILVHCAKFNMLDILHYPSRPNPA